MKHMLRILLPVLCSALGLHTMAQTILIPDTNLRLWLNYAKPNSVDVNGLCDTAAWNAQPPGAVGMGLHILPANSTLDLEGIQHLKIQQLIIGDQGESNITVLWPGHPRELAVLLISTVLMEDIIGPFFPLPSDLVSFTCNTCGLTNGLPAFNGTELEISNVDLSGQALTVSPTFERLTLDNCNLSTMPDFANVKYLTIHDNPLAGWPSFPNGLLALYANNVGLNDIPPVSAILLTLQLGYNGITVLPSIPSSLSSLYLEHNELSSLPPLPPELQRLRVDYNPITSLPPLPTTMFELEANYTDITALPEPFPAMYELGVEGSDIAALPAALDQLYVLVINNTAISALPPLPAGMLRIEAENTPQLSCLPPLPSTLYQLLLEGSGVTCLPNLPPGLNTGTLGIPVVVCELTNPCPIAVPRITGTTFHDADADGVFDTGEAPRPFSTVVAQPGDLLAGSDANGDYVMPAAVGDFTLTGVEVLYAPVSTAPYAITFAGPGETDSLNHVGFAVVPGMYDLVTEVVSGVVRPGFNTTLWVNVRNVGTEPTTAQVQLTFDAALTWVAAGVAPDDLNANLAQWTTADIEPGAHWTVQVTLYTPPFLALGMPITQVASATPVQADETPADNAFTLQDVVVGSYDPNDKRVQPGTLSPEEIAAGTPVDYTVRFQNTGTFPAERVLITDTLSSDLQRTSLRLTASSHACTWYLHYGVLHVLFEGINLPDSTSDEVGSHGFISFELTPVNTLLPGATVGNVANIFFDYNEPIITNEAVFAVEQSTMLMPGLVTSSGVETWPNPVTSILHVRTSEATTGAIEVLDATGRIVLRERMAGTRMDLPVAVLNAGVYTLRCSTPQGVWSTRFVKH